MEPMQAAIDQAKIGVDEGDGGPFGASIVYKDQVIAVAHNTVIRDSDPTCHAEMNVIRAAAEVLDNHVLDECTLFTTSEPCPMCLSAIYWARIPAVYIGVDKTVAARYGFDDESFYQELQIPPDLRSLQMEFGVLANDCETVFSTWLELKRPLY